VDKDELQTQSWNLNISLYVSNYKMKVSTDKQEDLSELLSQWVDSSRDLKVSLEDKINE